ncbi:DUF3683 domain-containing protein [Candidatus Venteria ishoeyi]|uniref:DUF3683 domain-containing protein n=1 Tax=Candidatus Venteria ishoeyi TaxID=1899563 RepID=UPI0025A5A5E6|nr:DUF3683 domain-containing protein [Candidatus Venteria ishoeyi]MDM8547364.1 DUF3683 domain-containing protein [Candidatus Venteria ishoeyi]
MKQRIREIPYNYTSFSDREIVLRLLGQEGWEILQQLRGQRVTGRSARMLLEVLGDMWVVQRNPFIQDDLLAHPKRRQDLLDALYHRLEQVRSRAQNNQLALQLAGLAQQAAQRFDSALQQQHALRAQVSQRLAKLTRADNICFDGLSRVSHATDATDWRVEHPLGVLTPDSEAELGALVQTCMAMGLPLIPRGGGTGYTGSAVPLTADALVINTEKLDAISAIQSRQLPGLAQAVNTVRVEAGVVTVKVTEAASKHNLVFAVDPTSQEASTIGGNIAMNAGGKKAVLWGTTLDNLLSWKMLMPAPEGKAHWVVVERLKHNLGKIHEQETVEFRITRLALDGQTSLGEAELICVPGHSFRKIGLGKDVTNKVLHQIPGVQKEGCDGLITSAEFILHPQPAVIHTVCMEFFGTVREAVPAITETIDDLGQMPNVQLAGLEHLDARYIKAVQYSTKSSRAELPRMVLLADIAADNLAAVEQATQVVVQHTQARNGEAFIATSSAERQRFWVERKRTAAIAAHTNAFKINEDVVIPLDKLADYSDGIERINIEQSIRNKLKMLDGFADYIAQRLPQQLDEVESAEIIQAKQKTANTLLKQIRAQWLCILEKMDESVAAHPDLFDSPALQQGQAQVKATDSLFQALQQQQLRVSFRHSIERPLKEIFNGRAFVSVRQQFDKIHQNHRASRLFVALHMHAGDGNVHTNIPVNSHDYEMLHAAELMVDRIMQLASDLGGVISGEHGIGMTKLQYLDADSKAAFAQYKQEVDPQGFFNRGKLLEGSGLENAYTPSLRLLSQEALILEATDLGELNTLVKDCLRCGKCKPQCTTHIPRANLLYSPRNKILASGLLIEAVLYEEQTRRGLSIAHYQAFNDIADHCTVCHRCLKPCPVNIDFGDVTVKIREILRAQKQKRENIGSRLSMLFLNTNNPRLIRFLRHALIRGGYAGQRTGYFLAKALQLNPPGQQPAKTTGKTKLVSQVLHFVKKPLPGQLPAKPMRGLLNIENPHQVSIIRDPQQCAEDAEAVFYFPGCGSERLFSQVGLATLAMLYHSGVQTVLPPGYLCCGYPQIASGDKDKGHAITMDNRVLFHRIANTLNYLDIKTVILSCGTCMDQLLKYEFQQIFPDCRLLDIHEYLMEKGQQLPTQGAKEQETQYLYHEPCHTPMKTHPPLQVIENLLGKPATLSDRCCGEAGTFAVARPDIATQVRFRKQQEIKQGIKSLTGQETAKAGNVRMLTSCPACQQGLARYQADTGMETDYIVVEMARKQLGADWDEVFVKEAIKHGMESVLL